MHMHDILQLRFDDKLRFNYERNKMHILEH